jgi:photosystem II S4 domain protein
MEREKILQRFAQDLERITAGIILDRIEQLERNGQWQISDFFDPHQQRTADRVLYSFPEFKSVTWGGYSEAERCRLLLYPAERQAGTADVALAALEVDAGLRGEQLGHRDFLGAILGLGLRREKIGDILVLEQRKAQIIVHPEILPFLLSNWQEVGKYSVAIREITLKQLAPPPLLFKEIKTTVASLRLDAVASAGFAMSRSKLTPAIRANQVKLNWQSVTSASASVKAGDVISLAGRGRLEVAEVLGESKKGRIQLLLKKRA